MSVEITLLVWSAVLALVYMSVQSLLYRRQIGLPHAAGARDDDPPPDLLAGRGERALRNFLETYAVFVALALAVEVTGRSDGLTVWGAQLWFWSRVVYLPLYVAGVPYLRSAVWAVSVLGLVLMIVGLLT